MGCLFSSKDVIWEGRLQSQNLEGSSYTQYFGNCGIKWPQFLLVTGIKSLDTVWVHQILVLTELPASLYTLTHPACLLGWGNIVKRKITHTFSYHYLFPERLHTSPTNISLKYQHIERNTWMSSPMWIGMLISQVQFRSYHRPTWVGEG